MFVILFKNFDKGHTLGKNHFIFKLAWLEKFFVVAEVAFFVGNPAISCMVQDKESVSKYLIENLKLVKIASR